MKKETKFSKDELLKSNIFTNEQKDFLSLIDNGDYSIEKARKILYDIMQKEVL